MPLIVYDGRIAAFADATCVHLAPHVEPLPAEHPDLRFVVFMCLYARDVMCGELPGPYGDETAELFARCALIPDDQFALLAHLADHALGECFRVPLREIARKRADLRIQAVARR